MTTINNAISNAVNSALLVELGAELGQLMNFGGQVSIQPGLTTGGSFQPAAPAFTASMGAQGKAEVDLGDGYTLSIDERNSEIVVRDADGNVTRIWGDPHFEHNGRHVGDFWGTTTLTLENGTKLTINTEPFGNNPNAYVASEVVITRGDQALVIGGVSQNKLGDLSLSMSNSGGALLDLMNDDGLVIHEKPSGGWTSSITGAYVTQAHFDLTRPGMEGVREALEFGSALAGALGAWLTVGSLLQLAALGAFDTGGGSDTRAGRPLDRLIPALAAFSAIQR